MALTKCVAQEDGTSKYVEMTPEEEAKIRAQWAIWETNKQARDAAREAEVRRQAALKALDEQRLSDAALDETAPQEVKDYVAAKQGG